MKKTGTDQPKDKRCRETHPERIELGDTIFERNDITAKRYGVTERTINLEDRRGAPYRKFGNIKYRPIPLYDQHVISSIQSQKPKQERKRRRARP